MKDRHKRALDRIKQSWAWLTNKPWRLVVAVLVVLSVLAAAIWFTGLRYSLLGGFIQVPVAVTVTDASTKLAVPKALVELAGSAEITDKAGHANFKSMHPGKATLLVRKIGYKDASSPVTVEFGGGTFRVALRPNGIALDAAVTNRLTGAALAGALVKAGEAEALTDDKGMARLSMPPATDSTKVTVEFSRDGYNSAGVEVQVRKGAAPINAALVPAGKVYFLSNRNGNIDLYGSNLDGSASKVVLAGTGNEDQATGILPNISNHQYLALVSSRDGKHKNGQLQHDLFIFDTEGGALTKIDEGVDFGNFRAWLGDTLVYEKSKYDPTVGGCDDLKSYSLQTHKTSTFFASNGHVTGCPLLTVALSDAVFYTVRYTNDPAKQGLFVAKASGNSTKVSSKPADNTVRRVRETLLTEYYNYTSNPNQEWDSVSVGTLTVTHLANGPSNETSRYYNDSPTDKYSSFVEERDGKSELYLTDGNGDNEHKLTAMGSVNQFVQWYGDEYIVFSSTRTDENALYVVAASGGAPVKVSDFYRGNNRTYGGGGNAYY